MNTHARPRLPVSDLRASDLRASDLQALRRRIGERFAPLSRPAVSLSGPVSGEAGFEPDPEFSLEAGALHECVPAGRGDFAAALGFAFALATRVALARPGAVLWTFAARQAFERGALYPLGLTAFGLDPNRLIQVRVPKPRAMLWAMEEGLSHSALAAVIGLMAQGDRAYDFTASRRLAMRAAKNGVTALLVRADVQSGMATAAATRWQIAAEPVVSGPIALPRGKDLRVGPPRWAIERVKSKTAMPGHRQVVEWDHETLSFRLVAAMADRAPPLAGRAGRDADAWAAAS